MLSKISDFLYKWAGTEWKFWHFISDIYHKDNSHKNFGPSVQIRNDKNKNKNRTVFFVYENECAQTFVTSEAGPIFAEWRSFVKKAREDFAISNAKYVTRSSPWDRVAQSNVIRDSEGYKVGPLVVYKKFYTKKTEIWFGDHRWTTEANDDFDEWLNAVEELHKPYLKDKE